MASGEPSYQSAITDLYLQRWDVGLNYVNFFGAPKAGLREDGNFSYGQSLADRDFALSI